MNIELYIKSGVVESYAFGLASPREAADFEMLLPLYPELGEALSEFEYRLELFAIEQETPPPIGVREKIFSSLQQLPAVSKGPSYLSVETSDNHIRVHKYWRTAFIALFILSKILLATSIYFFVEYRNTQKQLLQLQQQTGNSDRVTRVVHVPVTIRPK